MHVCRHAQNARVALQTFVEYRFTLSDNLFMTLVEETDEPFVVI